MSAFAADEMSAEDAAKVVEQFNLLDANGDGMLSEDELADSAIAESWGDGDADGDGSLNEEEFVAIAASTMQSN